MKILQNDGKFEVWNDFRLAEQLQIIEAAGRVCWKSDSVPEKRDDFIRMLIKKGHHSVLEHSSMTVRFWNVSRGFTHELVRHRLAAFSQRSTRYVNPIKKDCSNFVVPPQKQIGDMEGMIKDAILNYHQLVKNGMLPQDARQVLPIGIETEIVMTANFREWRHIFEVRCQKAAHWEIRTLMCELLEWCQENIPVIFEDFVLYKHGSKEFNYAEKETSND